MLDIPLIPTTGRYLEIFADPLSLIGLEASEEISKEADILLSREEATEEIKVCYISSYND